MNPSRRTQDVVFTAMDEIYLADSCVPLADAADAGRVRLDALARGHYPGRPLPERQLEGLRTIGYWDASTDQDWGLDWHRNEGIEITYVASGNVEFAVDETSWDLHAGDVTVTRPWQRHRVGDPDVTASNLQWLILDVGVRRPNQVWAWPDWIALTPDDLARLTQLLQHNEHAVWKGNEDLSRAFARAIQAIRRDEPRESELRILISALLLELLRTLEEHRVELDDTLTTPKRGVRLFLRDLESQVDHRWTLQTMADACSMGRTQFSRHCQDLTNMTPIEYLNHLRLSRGSRLLTESDLSVTDIAYCCGFETPQYFATRFRKAFAVSPAAFRARKRQESASASTVAQQS